MNCYQKFYTNQIHSSSLLCQLATMWKSQVLCDAIIKSGSINIKAHRVVLVAACPMLQSMENAAVGSHLEVRLASDIKQESINTFLQYLYEGFMLLTEENCKDVEKIGRLLQVDSVIKCCADFFKCLSSKTGLVDLNEQYRYTNYQDVEFKHVRSSHIQKTLQEKSLKRGIDVVRPASPSSKRHRYHNADDTFSMSQSYNVTDPWERVPRAGAPSHRQSSSQPGVIDVVEDSLELVQTDPPGSTNSATNRQANNKSVSISVSSQLNRDSNVQVVNVPDANKKQNDQSNKQSQQHNNQNQSVASPLTALCEMSSPNNDSPLHRAPDITAGTLKKQMPSPMHSHSAITHSMPSPHSIDSSFPSPQSYDTSQQSSHQSRPVPVAKPFAAGSASQTGPLFSMMATSSSMPSPSSLRRSESQSSTGSKDTDRPAVDTGQTTGSVASPSESKVNEENIADLNIVKIESDDSNTGGLDMYVDTNEDGIVKLTRNTDDDLDDTSATDQSYDWTRERMEGGLEGNQTWFAGQTQDDIEDDDVDDLIIVSHEPAISSGSRGYLSNTIMRTKRDIKILKEWLQKHDEPWNIEDMSAEQLNSALEKFYTRATTRAGSQYNRNTLLVMRASMNRYFMSLPEDKKKDLIKQPEFMTSNGIISKREKIVTASYKRVIAMEDLTKLVKSGVISTNTPTSLMRKVWLDLMIHFGLKGREAIRNLRKDSFLLNIDEHGMKYYCLNSKEMATVRDYSEMSDWFWECRMYEEPDSPFCPVNSLSLYLSKLSQSHPSLFQRPIDNCFITQGVCYSGPCGSTFLIKMMGEISYEAKLSTSYSATCIKYTVQQMMSCRPIDPNTKIAFYRLMKGGMSQEPMRPLSTEALRDCSRYMHAFFYNLH